MGDIQTVGRIGIKALLWFFSASLFSLLLGMLLVNVFEPGSSLHIALPSIGAETGLPQVKPTLGLFVAHIFPKSITEAMAANEILQIVVFSMFFGIACASLGDLARPTVKLLDSLAHIMLKVTKGGPELILKDENGKAGAELRVGKDVVALGLFDNICFERVQLGMTKDGQALSDETGELIWKAP